MPIRFLKTKVVFSGSCKVEEAEEIFQWLTSNPKAELHMSEVTHLHAAVLQAVAAARNRIVSLPRDVFCAEALRRLGRV